MFTSCIFSSQNFIFCALYLVDQLFRLFADPMSCSPPAPLSLEFSRQDYWSRLPFPTPGHLLYPGIEPTSLAFPALAGEVFITSTTWEAPLFNKCSISNTILPSLLPYHSFLILTLLTCLHVHSTCLCVLSRFSCVLFFVTLWTVACQAPLSMGFSRQEYWSQLPCPSWGNLSEPGIELASPAAPALQADSLPLSHQGSP